MPFLLQSKDECEYLINLAKPHMHKSSVVDSETGKSKDSRSAFQSHSASFNIIIRFWILNHIHHYHPFSCLSIYIFICACACACVCFMLLIYVYPGCGQVLGHFWQEGVIKQYVRLRNGLQISLSYLSVCDLNYYQNIFILLFFSIKQFSLHVQCCKILFNY